MMQNSTKLYQQYQIGGAFSSTLYDGELQLTNRVAPVQYICQYLTLNLDLSQKDSSLDGILLYVCQFELAVQVVFNFPTISYCPVFFLIESAY